MIQKTGHVEPNRNVTNIVNYVNYIKKITKQIN